MKQLTRWQGIALLTATLQIGLIARFWLEGMDLSSSIYSITSTMLLISMAAHKQPNIRWLLLVFLALSLFSWINNFTIGVG
jgi:hypothetical protein